MTGISSTLSIASQALTSQQYAISVTGQNVANVDNASYTRQTVAMSSNMPVKINGIVLGTGVSIEQVTGVLNSYLDTALLDKSSSLASFEEMELYLSNIETVIGSDSDSGLSSLLSDFWNAWSDVANNPASDAERVLVYEYAVELASQFNTMDQALMDVSVTLESELGIAVSQVNELTTEIAALNVNIVSLEAGGASANDLRDQRNERLAELSDLIGCSYFEEENGSISILTAEGYPMVSGAYTHTLTYSSGQILWEGSSGTVDITDEISGGKIEGWLTLRDEKIPEYQAELDSLAQELIWQVNLVCSQGMGEDYYSHAMTSDYGTDSSELLSTLFYGNRIDTSSDCVIWIEDQTTYPSTFASVPVDLSAAAPLASASLTMSGTANEINGNYIFTLDPPTASLGGATDVTVSWASSNGSGRFVVAAGDVTTVHEVDGMSLSLSAVTGPFTNGTFTVSTDADGDPAENVSSYTITDLAADINAAVTAAGGGVAASVTDGHLVLTPDSDEYAFGFSSDNGNESGLAAALGLNTFFTGTNASSMDVSDRLSDSGNVQAARIDQDTGTIASGDNTNAQALSSLQDQDVQSRNWTYERGEAPVSSALNGTFPDIFQTLVSSVGTEVKVVGIQAENYGDMVASLQDRRDAVSAVSLDEEMINLTRYQTAYQAASKLLSVVDDMLSSILSLR